MVSRFFIFFIFFTVIAFSGWAQSALKAIKQLEKDNLERVIKIVEKSVGKSPTDPANYYVLANYYIHPDFGLEAVDSANQYISLARSGWINLETKEKEKYARKGMDSTSIDNLSSTIDSLAFEKAKILNTEKDYNHFIENYNTVLREEAIELRNEVAYEDAVSKNSPEAMEQFFSNYPDAKQAKNARDIYETLFYEKFTETGTLLSYQNYLTEKPQSMLREEAALRILEIISTGADSSILQTFINKYPKTQAAATAGNLMQYWRNEGLFSTLLVHFKSGSYYFFDTQKQKLLDFSVSSVEMDSCGQVNSTIIGGDSNGSWYDRLGNTFLDQLGSRPEYLQSGFFKVFYSTESLATLIHLSKDSVFEQKAVDFRKIDDYFLTKKVGQKWQLISFLGEEILSQPVDSIWTEHDLYFFKNSDRMAVSNRAELRKSGKKDFKALSLLYTDYELYDNGSIWLESNDFQSVLKADLTPVIPLKKVVINKIPLGWIVQNGEELTILTNDFKSQISLLAQDYKANSSIISIKNEDKWAVISSETNFPEFVYDSIRLFNSWLTYLEAGEKKELFFNDGERVVLENGEYFKILRTYNEEVLNSEGQVRFVEVVNKKGYSQIYNSFGRKIKEGEDVKVDVLTSEILQINTSNEKFLMDSAGNTLFTEKVDAFGSMQNGLIPILKNKKFGAFQINNRQLIPFKSDVKIQVFVPNNLFVYQKDGSYGIMDASGKNVLENKFKSIDYLNDSLAFVEIENVRQVINIRTEEVLIDEIKIVEKRGFKNQNFYLIRLNSGYGIINSSAQEIIPFIFNSIEAITYNNQMLWKAERRIAEMDYQVIAYFNAEGELLFREGFTNEEYLKTACD